VIAFLDLARQYKEVEAEITAALVRALGSGSYILGREVEAFEDEWARFCGVRGAAAVACGTDALALALIASGAVRKSHADEVITSPLTAAYTALAIMNAGGVPVFADIDPHTYTLSPQALEKAITPRTRAIIPVHLYGQLADMAALCDIAARHGLMVIEDAAQAHGAQLGGLRAGAYGHAAAFSFYPTKNLGAYGDGGAVTSNDTTLIERVKILRQGGHIAAIQGRTEGRNSRLDEIQAAMLRVKLKYLEPWNRQRQTLAKMYGARLRGTSVRVPWVREPDAHVYHLYVIQHPTRDRLRSTLAARGIATMIHYPYLLHQQALFWQGGRHDLLEAERAAERILSLPLYPQLRIEEIHAVIEAILDCDT
jgi:dTDP-4-amino-4,6-dideoxygalactose transaminase